MAEEPIKENVFKQVASPHESESTNIKPEQVARGEQIYRAIRGLQISQAAKARAFRKLKETVENPEQWDRLNVVVIPDDQYLDFRAYYRTEGLKALGMLGGEKPPNISIPGLSEPYHVMATRVEPESRVQHFKFEEPAEDADVSG